MVSRIARPAETEPPGEFIYSEISFFGSSDWRNRSWAITVLATASSIGPPRKTTPSFKRREQISYERSPNWVLSTTIGINIGCELRVTILVRVSRKKYSRKDKV